VKIVASSVSRLGLVLHPQACWLGWMQPMRWPGWEALFRAEFGQWIFLALPRPGLPGG
jgi:hypothetical protein